MQFVRNLVLVDIFASFCAGIASAGPASNHLINGIKATDGLLVQIQGRCEALRRACENRDVLGERGAGNCRRYRETCGRYRPGCAELRRACSTEMNAARAIAVATASGAAVNSTLTEPSGRR